MKHNSKVAVIVLFMGGMMLCMFVGMQRLKRFFAQSSNIVPSALSRSNAKSEVAVQSYQDDIIEEQSVCNHKQSEPQPELAVIMPEPEPIFVISSDDHQNNDVLVQTPNDSFMSMPAKDCVFDAELYMTFDALMGKDLNEFVRLVLQSNNNVVSKFACRSCSMYAFFNKLKKRKPLSIDEIAHLQSLLVNLHRFVKNMQQLSKTVVMRPEQWQALQELYQSQAEKNQAKIEKRKAITAAALKKLQSMTSKK